MKTFRIATRKSKLALWQAHYIKDTLLAIEPDLMVELVGITSEGDRLLDTSLAKIGGKGLFTKALEEALLENRADIAVHSMKDMPVELPDGLIIGAICQREDPRDVLLSRKNYISIDTIPNNAVLGTSSLRRQSQLLALRPDLQCKLLRGNVDTRINKLTQGDYDVIILAAAGLKRLDITEPHPCVLSPEILLPAAGQGAIGIECRRDDLDTKTKLANLNHVKTQQCVLAERAMNRHLGGSCQTPIGAYAQYIDHQLVLKGMVGKTDGSLLLKAEQGGDIADAETIGITVGHTLLEKGADLILKKYKGNL